MIIDDSITFFGVYYHNCIFHLNLTKEFADLYSKDKYKNVLLCQKDQKGGYLLTQSIMSKDSLNPYMQSYYYYDKKSLQEGFRQLSNKVENCEKTFYLLRSNNNYDMSDTEQIVKKWKQEVKNATQES